MKWLLAKLDSLVGAVFAATFGLAASQLFEFIQQYRQRLGGHLDEAQLALRKTLDNTVFRGLDVPSRQALLEPQSARLSELANALNALSAAGPWELPWTFVWHIDFSIAGSTLRAYRSALPLDVVSLSYAAAGMAIGWLVWEMTKLVARLRRRVRRP